MDITKLNFDDKFDELKDVINNATFFSIDGEFTGLPNADVSAFDSLAEFYTKTSGSTEEYIIIQLGFTAFRLINNDSDDDKDSPSSFTYRSYNFYIYPQDRLQRFACQGGSMQFLSMHKFDFNKLFHHGISFCDKPTEADLIEKFNEKKKWLDDEVLQEENSNLIDIPVDEKEKIDRIRDNLEEFLVSSDKEKIIGNLNGFQRRLVYQLIETEFSDRISAQSVENPNNRKVILCERKKTREEEKEQLREKIKREEIILNERVGFGKFMDLLSNSKKLIIGHNMLLDVMYILRQFFAPLPKAYKNFKIMTHKAFPNLLDTKFLCQSDLIKDKLPSTILAPLYETIQQKPFSLPQIVPESIEYSYSNENPKEHEAGYDSYITGVCFIALAQQLKIKPNEMNEKSQALRTYINKLVVFRLANNTFMNLAGKEPEPRCEHIFHINIPPNWGMSNVIHHFRNYGSVFISWTGPNAAYVSLNQREHAPIVIRTIDKPKGFHIQSYADYHKSKEINFEETSNSEQSARKRKIPDGKSAAEISSNKKTRKNKNEATASTSEKKASDSKVFSENNDW